MARPTGRSTDGGRNPPPPTEDTDGDTGLHAARQASGRGCGGAVEGQAEGLATQLNSPEDFEEAFGICRIDGIRDDSKVRLTITIYHQEMKSAVHRALLAAKCEHKPGEAPAGWMEDEVQEWIDALQGTV